MAGTDLGMEYLSSGSSAFHNQWMSFSSTSQPTEPVRNKVAERCSKEILHYVFHDEYIEGDVGKTHLYLENIYLTKGVDVFRDSFQLTWINLFTNNNPTYLYTLACISAGLPFEWFETHGLSALLGCSSHKSELVNEACIRMAESWEQPDHALYLDNMRSFDIEWLEKYKLETIIFLKSLS